MYLTKGSTKRVLYLSPFFSETSFSAKELDALGRDGTQERIARSSEGVERNTRAIDEKVRALQGRLFFNDVKSTTWSE